MINVSTEGGNLPFTLPAIQIATNSPRVTTNSVSLSGSQLLCTFCCTGRQKYSTQYKSPLFMHNINLNKRPQEFSYKRTLSFKFV